MRAWIYIRNLEVSCDFPIGTCLILHTVSLFAVYSFARATKWSVQWSLNGLQRYFLLSSLAKTSILTVYTANILLRCETHCYYIQKTLLIIMFFFSVMWHRWNNVFQHGRSWHFSEYWSGQTSTKVDPVDFCVIYL